MVRWCAIVMSRSDAADSTDDDIVRPSMSTAGTKLQQFDSCQVLQSSPTALGSCWIRWKCEGELWCGGRKYFILFLFHFIFVCCCVVCCVIMLKVWNIQDPYRPAYIKKTTCGWVNDIAWDPHGAGLLHGGSDQAAVSVWTVRARS
jgi:hypothetical protein